MPVANGKLTLRFVLLALALFLGHQQSSEAADAAPPITAGDVEKIVRFAQVHGSDASISPRVTAALGITQGEDQLTLRQILVQESGDKMHVFYKLPNEGYLIASLTSEGGNVYRLDKDLNFVAAIMLKGNEAPVAIPSAEARESIDAELGGWARVAPQLPD